MNIQLGKSKANVTLFERPEDSDCTWMLFGLSLHETLSHRTWLFFVGFDIFSKLPVVRLYL
jgi:hypothetical protein